MRKTVALLGILLAAEASTAAAQAGTLSPQEKQAILGYQLTVPRANQLITALDAMTKYVVSLPDFQSWVAKSMKMSAAEKRAQMEGDPKAMAILKQNGLTAPDYLAGVPALRMALMAAQGASGPSIVVSPANLAFAKSNLKQLKTKMDAADGIRPPR